jgi:phosphopantothenoylcysteine synthetase/decarboxylase
MRQLLGRRRYSVGCHELCGKNLGECRKTHGWFCKFGDEEMKILVTSGGTKVKIDAVRSITNMSTGNFASKIALSFMCKDTWNSSLDFLMAKESKTPGNRFGCYVKRYIEYVTFKEYSEHLFSLIGDNDYDIILLAAAVSDYGVDNYVDGKIRSSDELVIRLKPLPKLISMVRTFAPNAVICGFKLLVNSTHEELLAACKDSLEKNRLDLVVGNDLRDIKNNDHKLLIAKSDGEITEHSSKTEHLPDVVAQTCLDIAKRKMS